MWSYIKMTKVWQRILKTTKLPIKSIRKGPTFFVRLSNLWKTSKGKKSSENWRTFYSNDQRIGICILPHTMHIPVYLYDISPVPSNDRTACSNTLSGRVYENFDLGVVLLTTGSWLVIDLRCSKGSNKDNSMTVTNSADHCTWTSDRLAT